MREQEDIQGKTQSQRASQVTNRSETRLSGLADVNRARLFYQVSGSGYPLVLLHAGVADCRMWDDQFDAFAQHFKTIRYDLRGFGRSSMPPGSFASHEDAAGLLKLLGIESAHVVGISFGGGIALDLALAHPQVVSRLVLCAPSVGGFPVSETMKRFWREEEAALARGDPAAATDLNVRLWVDGPYRSPQQVNPQVRERVREMQLLAFQSPEPEDAEQLPLVPPAIQRLSELQIPVLIIVGDQDLPEKLELADRLARELPHARQAVIKGAAHMMNMEQPEIFNRVVLDFLHES